MKKYRYTGDGSQFYSGVPARDLTDHDFEALDEQHRRLVIEGSLYEPVVEEPPAEEPATRSRGKVSNDGR